MAIDLTKVIRILPRGSRCHHSTQPQRSLTSFSKSWARPSPLTGRWQVGQTLTRWRWNTEQGIKQRSYLDIGLAGSTEVMANGATVDWMILLELIETNLRNETLTDLCERVKIITGHSGIFSFVWGELLTMFGRMVSRILTTC